MNDGIDVQANGNDEADKQGKKFSADATGGEVEVGHGRGMKMKGEK